MNILNRDATQVWSCLIMATALAAVIPGVAVGQTPMVVNHGRATASSAAAVNYWTAAKMAAAAPMIKPVSKAPKQPAAGSTPATGTPGVAGGWRPDQPQSLLAPLSPLSGEATETSSAVVADGSYPGPNETFEYFPRYTKYPISAIGKLFFTAPDGSDHYCTATVTVGSSTNLNMIWTAGHCVAVGDNVHFNSNWLFCPSDDNGAPLPSLGCWTWAFATTSSEWFQFGALTRDFAIIGLQPTGTLLSTNVANVTGGLGFAWNFGRDQHWIHIGYPQNSPWTGFKLIETAAEHRYDDTPDSHGPADNSWGSTQGPGSSGSALILSFDYVAGGFINSNVSYFYTSQEFNELQGPYYDTEACTFWKTNTGFTGTC